MNIKGLFLQRLYLRNFRRYEEALFEFDPALNSIVGPNAQGKTTVLEAIQFLMNGRSFRTAQATDLIKHGQSSFFVEASFIKQGIEQTLKIGFDGKDRKIVYNSTPFQANANLLGLIQGVVVTPDDVSLIKGSPLLRRHFLDLQIAQVDPLYVHYLTRYTRAMRQRNILLKSKSLVSIDSWEQEMSGSAAYVVLQRKKAVGDLQKLVNTLHFMLTNDPQQLSVEYKHGPSQIEDPLQLRDYYLSHWQKNRLREKDLGITLSGPHRDDLLIKIAQLDARLFASEGQQRSCVMALKLAEWQRLNQICQEPPLMLVDDVGISLDGSRKQKLLEHLKTLGQVFMTSTEALA